ncbi:MAG: carbamoyltransferase HypF [Calditrichaeota bacterium]|nr:carbamoyltransferase HypF [Calditrichota bacterium]
MTNPKAMKAFHIHIQGKVQGVGFRPFVYRLATEMGLTGWVNNGKDGVHIEVEGMEETLQRFVQRVQAEAPAISHILSVDVREIPRQGFAEFRVRHSSEEGLSTVLILPDLDMCDDCNRELHDPNDRRYDYPFITCTNCGPRYSIITRLPYDRPNTTMVEFPMCPPCEQEYRDPADRRFYSQTNSCSDCGIQLTLTDNRGNVQAEGRPAFLQAVEALRRGKIVAVKGIGGYLLMVDACDEAAVQELRRRKRRPTKPLALMYPDVQAIQRDVQLTPEARDWLIRRSKPIVICDRLQESPIAPAVAPHQNTLGVMLPYTPLHVRIMELYGKPAVATSGNVSGSPILFKDSEALELLGAIADFFLMHNREIVVPQDDSVIRVTPVFRQTIFYRRSRSFAPIYVSPHFTVTPEEAILAMGAQQKSTITLTHQGNIYISQYLGDLDTFESWQNYQRVLTHLMQLLEFQPQCIGVDAHPDYVSTRRGEELSRQYGVPIYRIQHHKAHFWALLAEANLLTTERPVLGVIWDGTGYGEDGAIWGGEFFLYREGQMSRMAHLEYYPLLLGEKAIREPRLCALGLWHTYADAESLLLPKFSPGEWKIYQQLLKNHRFLRTSSMGRLFDGVASLLGVMDRVSFEGEAAMRLEALAWQFVRGEGGLDAAQKAVSEVQVGFAATPHSPMVLSLSHLKQQILDDLQAGVPVEQIAFRFHYQLVKWIDRIARTMGVRDLAFSGGVFQNALLVDLCHRVLGDRYRLHWHRELSPNDENISFGQMVAIRQFTGKAVGQ